ncbi:MAG: hypothetical protein KUG77_03245 [Nannocystaceae bacterium]|nr:hypothetical protein [Nannocystaceae bacterium]
MPRLSPGTVRLFGHADASGDEHHNKLLSERRAAALLALFESDVDTMVGLADDDGWGPWEFQVLLRVLGSDPGPTDGDPGELTKSALEHFTLRYRSGAYSSGNALRVPEFEPNAFDKPTREAILDAFVRAHQTDLGGGALNDVHPFVGCSEFNLANERPGSSNRRVSLLVNLDDPHPKNAPCKRGEADRCAIVGDPPYTCMWYREHVDVEPAQLAEIYDPRWTMHPHGKSTLSVLTNTEDEHPFVFQVFEHSGPVPTDHPDVDIGSQLGLELTAVSVGGVATTSLDTPSHATTESPSAPVFRVRSASGTTHAWGVFPEVVGVQLVDARGPCFAGTLLELQTPTGPRSLETDANGIGSLRTTAGATVTLQIPQDLLIPHPRDRVTLKTPATTADLEVTRGGNATLVSGALTRLRVLSPRPAPGTVSCHFDEGTALPADTLAALVQEAKLALAATSDMKLVVFGHAQGGGPEAVTKKLSEQRAKLVRAVLQSDGPALASVADEDGWGETHFLSILHTLGYEEDPNTPWAPFQRSYNAGHHRAATRNIGHGELEVTGKLDAPTREALLDAWLSENGGPIPSESFAPTPTAGCASFVPSPTDEHPDRATVVAFSAAQLPAVFPCTEGDSTACHVDDDGRCDFFSERVSESSLRLRILDTAEPPAGAELLYSGPRVRVHQAARVAGVAHFIPDAAEDVFYVYTSSSTRALEATTPVGAAPKLLPRVHLTAASDSLVNGLSRERFLRPDMSVDGSQIRPMGGRTGTIEEVFLGFWSEAVEVLSETACQPPITLLATLRGQLVLGQDVAVPSDPDFDPVRALDDRAFTKLLLTAGLVAAGQTLNPFESQRYTPTKRGTFACNIYAADLVNLGPHGAWIPKVEFALPVAVRTGRVSVDEARLSGAGPTSINRFLTRGKDYGWSQLPGDPANGVQRQKIRNQAQKLANDGHLVVMSKGNSGRTGHVATVMPTLAFLTGAQRKTLTHVRDAGALPPEDDRFWGFDKKPTNEFLPVRSQAGAVNGHGMRKGVLVLSNDSAREFTNPAYFVYDATTDQSRNLPPVERPSKTAP